MTSRPGRQALVEQLLADGITHVFGNPGTVEQGFLDVLEQYPELTYVLTLQETVAAGIADGYARATKRPTVLQLHSGVGLGNGIGMLYQSKRGHAPLVVIAGESGIRYDAMDAQMAADLVAMAEPVTKWSTRVLDPASLLRIVRRAVKIAMTPPMGPVFVSLPMDVLDAMNDELAVPSTLLETRSLPAPDLVARAAALLVGAVRPLIVVGDGVAVSGAQVELVRLAELLGADVVGADDSEPNMPWTHPLWRGQLGHMFGEHSAETTRAADAVLVVGTYVLPEVFPLLQGVFAPGARVVHVDLDGYEIAKNFPVDLGLVADPKTTLAALSGSLGGLFTEEQRSAARARLQARTEQRAALAAHEAGRLDGAADSVPLHAGLFMQALAQQLPAGSVVFDEALTTSPEVTRYLVPEAPGSYYQTRGGSLGVGLPGAIGVKMAEPERTVVGFTGDGGSMYTFQALWTAARYGVAAKFVVCNNSRYQLLNLNIQQYWRERGIPEHEFPGCFDLGRPEIQFADLAQALGVQAVRVEKPDQIRPAIERMLAHDGPFLIDLVLGSEVPGHTDAVAAGRPASTGEASS
ncbi:MAG: thiamine pyrophosphate TPP-binding protein [Frankiales bacterium]|nr:thiamine pyrophosphate TPP-binding protein [Frankiales bacterium]